MSMPRYAARRDLNETSLKQTWEKLGWRLWKLNEPADWLGLRNGHWHVIEIKNPSVRGHANEYTPNQKIFMRDVSNCGGRILTWYDENDILRDSGAR